MMRRRVYFKTYKMTLSNRSNRGMILLKKVAVSLLISLILMFNFPAQAAAPGGKWWDTSYQYRSKITITAGTAAVPSDYSVSVTFNHASLVTAGKSQASGNDVRMLYWTGAAWVELDRVLDTGSAWNSASTKIWFKTQAAISAGASADNYYLYYGNSSAANPPANSANIFLFFDDFEAVNLNKWTIVDGLWQIASDQRHAGTYSLKYPSEASTDRHIVANPALNEANVYLEAWWRFNNVSTMDLAQLFRRPGSAHSGYETNLEGTSGWDIAKEINGVWSELLANAGTPVASTWTRIGIAIYGTGMRVFKDGTQINPASGSFNVSTELASGNIGFRKWNVGSGYAWWIDDVVARKYVDPEPTTALAAEESPAEITSLTTDKGSYGQNETIYVNLTAKNGEDTDITNSILEYVIFIDSNLDGQPTTGETYILSGGTGSGSWSPGNYTKQTTGFNVTGWGGTNSDSWNVSNSNFPQMTTYTVWVKWYKASDTYDTANVTFYSVPTLGYLLLALLVLFLVYTLLGKGVLRVKRAAA